MRITQSMYYKSIYGKNDTHLNNKLFDVNKQIASGIKIQYAKDDVQVFADTMRLDNEIAVLKQIKTSVDSGYKMADQSDVVLSAFEEKLSELGPLLIQAVNDTNDNDSRDAIAKQMRTIEKTLKELANTSVNGKYLFSGSLVDVKPIDDNGIYHGNDKALSSFAGSNVTQQYNVTGAELFLGENSSIPKIITSNIVQRPNIGTSLDTATTMADYNGLSAFDTHHFYLRGVKSDGTSFKSHIKLQNTDNIGDLLFDIGQAYGNGATDVVNVSMNDQGQIVVEDKIKGSSKLDFHMVAAVDFGGVEDQADITRPILPGPDPLEGSIDRLVIDSGTTDYNAAQGSATQLFVREYNKSSVTLADGVSASLDSRVYDRTEFVRDASKLTSTTSNVLKRSHIDGNENETISIDEINSFAKPSTKISEVADLSQGIPGTLNGTVLKLDGTDIGNGVFSATINFLSSGSTFTVNGTTYDIFNMETPRTAVDADEMTYQQLMDVINLVVTGEAGNLTATPAGTPSDYDSKIEKSNQAGITKLTYDGKIEFEDLSATTTKATIAIYDANSDNFKSDASVMTFNTNNSLIVRDPKIDFFSTLDEIIQSVENYKHYPDASSGDIESIGIDNALRRLEDLREHVGRIHASAGAQSKALSNSYERTSLLEISTATLRSSVIDTDLAEASLTLTQLSLNYEAMLSTVGKVSRLSLVNYL